MPLHNIKAVTYFWRQVCLPGETRFNQIWHGKSNKIQFCLLCCRECRGEGNLRSILNLNYFIQAAKFWWPTQKLLCPSRLLSFSCGSSETWCGLLRGHTIHT